MILLIINYLGIWVVGFSQIRRVTIEAVTGRNGIRVHASAPDALFSRVDTKVHGSTPDMPSQISAAEKKRMKRLESRLQVIGSTPSSNSSHLNETRLQLIHRQTQECVRVSLEKFKTTNNENTKVY